MKLALTTAPKPARLMADEIAAGKRAVTTGAAAAGDDLNADWRRQITGAGLGTRLAKTIRSARYPKTGASIDAAALVWPKAPEIVDAHDRGALIRSADGFYQAIPRRRPERAAWTR